MSSSTVVGTGPITLTVPAVPSMARVARLTASSIAALVDASIDDIDDIKIAVSEVVSLLVRHGDGSGITLTFSTGSGTFAIDGTTTAAPAPAVRDEDALSAAVLEAVSVDTHIADTDGRATVRVTLALTGDLVGE